MGIFILFIVIIIMLVGLLGTLLPVIPGTPLIFLAALGYGFYDKFKHITGTTLIILFILMLFTHLIDYISSVVGARKYGASRMGIIGAFIGGIIGLIIFQLPGIILGPFIGAFVGELLVGQNFEQALKVGIGTLVGLLGGTIIKIITAVAMMAYFIIKLL